MNLTKEDNIQTINDTEVTQDKEISGEAADFNEERPDNSGNIKSLPADKKFNSGGTDTYVHEFKKPFEYQGTKYKSIVFKFGELTGRDFVDVENEMTSNSEYAIDPILSRSYLGKLASRAGNIPSDALEAMTARDFKKITDATRNFLADLDS